VLTEARRHPCNFSNLPQRLIHGLHAHAMSKASAILFAATARRGGCLSGACSIRLAYHRKYWRESTRLARGRKLQKSGDGDAAPVGALAKLATPLLGQRCRPVGIAFIGVNPCAK
jgi:hypothetical protein